MDQTINWKKLLALFVVFVGYLFLGAAIFHHLETDNESNKHSKLKAAKQRILDENVCMSSKELEELIRETADAISSGINPFGNYTLQTNWDYASAFFFAGTVVTTIGYGKVVPTTDWGRNACILYALLGIPFTGWLLATVGNFYHTSFHNIAGAIEDFLQDRIGCKTKKLRKILLCTVIFIISYCLIVILPSIWFYIMEPWSFEEAHYYAFITLSTIGFGDYVASVDSKHPKNQSLLWVYDIALACWYVLGLSYLACIITAVGKKQKHTITKIRTGLSVYAGKKDLEPPSRFALSDMDVTTETGFNKDSVDRNGCTCKHPNVCGYVLSVRDESTQTN